MQGGYETYTEKPGYIWDADVAFADVNPAEYSALVIAGGWTPEDIPIYSDCLRIIRHFFSENEPVGHLCRAPSALIAEGVLEGRRIASYPPLASDIQLAGGEFVQAGTIVDGTMLSGGVWVDNPARMREFFRPLRQKASFPTAI
jgi:protease I